MVKWTVEREAQHDSMGALMGRVKDTVEADSVRVGNYSTLEVVKADRVIRVYPGGQWEAAYETEGKEA
jgi:hypothetical protein